MGHLISWTHIDPDTPKELILFLSDKEIETKEGQKLIVDCGKGSDILGHGALCEYYGINGSLFPHLENTNMRSTNGFPQKIIDAVRNGNMNNIMRYAPADQLFHMLTAECQIIKQNEKPIENPTNYESEDFLPGVPVRTKEQVIARLDYIKKNDSTFLHGTGIDYTWMHKRNIGNVLSHFRWTNTKDGFCYWQEISRTVLVNTYNPESGQKDELYIRKTYENFLKLWKDNNNRLDCWKWQEEKEEKPKKQRKTSKRKKQTA